MTESLGKCVVCGKEAAALYPLLPNEPAFCSEHHNPKDAGPFGCDFTGPDDFDIPDEFLEYTPEMFDRESLIWTDKEGNEHELKDIDDQYLNNIINFLTKRMPYMGVHSQEYWKAVRDFLVGEQAIRAKEAENAERR